MVSVDSSIGALRFANASYSSNKTYPVGCVSAIAVVSGGFGPHKARNAPIWICDRAVRYAPFERHCRFERNGKGANTPYGADNNIIPSCAGSIS